jgi:pimeloyl-ACP methyl ester carboxylesterase
VSFSSCSQPAPSLRRVSRAARCIATLALPAACLTPLQPASADEAFAVEEAAALAHRHVQSALVFAPCTAPGFATLECATLPVPIDYRRPWVGTISLAVVRAKATTAKRIGVLFANPGGPAQSGLSFVAAGVNAPLFKRLRERFDIVSFDVRGSAASQAVRCTFPNPGDPEALPAAALPGFFDELAKTVAKSCFEQVGPVLASLSTNNIARDIDVLRRSMGEQQLTYVGASFGTSLGAVYGTLFPRHVRAMVLDAPVTPQYHDGKLDFRSEQAESFETVFQHLARLCSADTRCRLRGTGLVAAFDALLARLQTPVVSPAGKVLDARSLRAIISPVLSNEPQWPLIVDAVADATAGNFTPLLAALDISGAGGPPGQPIVLTAFKSILCNDFGGRRPAAETLPFTEALAPLYNHVESRFSVATSVSQCAAWPAPDLPLIRNLRDKLAVTPLVVGGTFDPNTPFAWTRSMASAIGAERGVLRYLGGGHTFVIGVPCVTQHTEAYLYDLKLPEEGAACAARPVVFNAGPAASTAAAMMRAQDPARAVQRWADQ